MRYHLQNLNNLNREWKLQSLLHIVLRGGFRLPTLVTGDFSSIVPVKNQHWKSLERTMCASLTSPVRVATGNPAVRAADQGEADLSMPRGPSCGTSARTEHSLCAAVTQHSGSELRLKAGVLRGLSADTNINSAALQRCGGGRASGFMLCLRCTAKIYKITTLSSSKSLC